MTTTLTALAALVSFALIMMMFAAHHRRTFHLPRAPFDSDASAAARIDSGVVQHDRFHQASAAR